MKVGCNYWASNAGTHMWRDWESEIVRRDFDMMSSAGIQVVRVFPLWSDFQPLEMLHGWGGNQSELLMKGRPLPETACGRAGVDETMVRRFKFLCQLAEERGMELIVGLVTGWMSGVLYVPPAFEGRHVMTEPLVMKWEIRYVRCLVRELKACKAIVMWELGNECNCMEAVRTKEEAWNWTNAIVSAIRLEDSTRPVASGMHGLTGGSDTAFDTSGNWTCETQGELCDYMTSHPYPHTTSKAPARVDQHDSIRLALQAAIETRLYGDLGKRPAFVEEIGTFSSSYCNDETKARFIRNTLFNSWAHGSGYFIWWCAFEHSVLDFPPYTWSTWERELGMYDEHFQLRPVGNELRRFRRFVEELPFKELPMFRRNAVCVIPRCLDFNATINNTWSSFVLAKQAGFDIKFQYMDESLEERPVYIVPGVAGTNWSRSFEYRRLMQKAAEGATVFITLNGGDLSPFAEYFGATVVTRETRTETSRFAWNGMEFTLPGSYRWVLKPNGCEVLGREANGNPVFIHNRYGAGDVYLLTLPLESYTAMRPGAYTSETEPPWWRIYECIGAKALAERIVRKDHPQVTLTEHFADEKHAWVVAVNNTPKAVPAGLTAVNGWRFAGEVPQEIRASSGIVVAVERD